MIQAVGIVFSPKFRGTPPKPNMTIIVKQPFEDVSPFKLMIFRLSC